jgi:hypothetical protein
MLTVVYCGILKVGAEPSMVVWLWRWFTNWAKGLGMDMPPTNGSLVCGLV